MLTALFIIRRTALLMGLVLAVIANTATAAFTVNSTADAVDANPGNDACATASGACTLRAAIMEANALPAAERLGQQSLAPRGSAAPTSAKIQTTDRTHVAESFGKLPLYFIENRGQADERITHYIQGKDKSVYFTQQGVTFVLSQPTAALKDSLQLIKEQKQGSEGFPTRYAVALEFLEANPVQPVGVNKTEAVISYFKGPKEHWHTALPTYTGLSYPELWNGVDLVYEGARSELKYTFHVKPGADPGQIQLAYRGADTVMLTDAGGITVTTPSGTLHDGAPIAWQEIDGARIAVPVSFSLDADTHTVSFTLGEYDHRESLVLDPAVVIYAGFIGGQFGERGQGIAADSAGNAYVTGYTYSTETTFPDGIGFMNYPGGLPTFNSHYTGSLDAFVAKVNLTGTALLYAGYIGGYLVSGGVYPSNDVGTGIAVDSAGNAYVTGFTNSNSGFPTGTGFGTLTSFDNTYNGGTLDAFVVKVNPTGTALLYAGFIGGSGYDAGAGIAVDKSNRAYVTGVTSSNSAMGFPTGTGFGALPTFDSIYNGGLADVFVVRVNAAGSGLEYAGYIGGSGLDAGYGIAVDGSGNAYVTGQTSSTNFPATAGSFDTTHNGGSDVFVAKVNATGTGLTYASYIGASDYEAGFGIAVDGSGNAYVTGQTSSKKFPTTTGSFYTTYNGTRDAFVTKVNAAGTALVYSGFIGGNLFDSGRGIAVNQLNSAYVTGETNSTSGFPVINGPDPIQNGGFDAFVAKINAAGTALVYSGFIGGNNIDIGTGIAVAETCAYVTGGTESSQTTFPEIIGPDLFYNFGPSDAFVARICEVGGPIADEPPPARALPPPPVDLTVNSRAPGETETVVINPIELSYTLYQAEGKELFLILNAAPLGISWSFLDAAGQWRALPADLSQITPFLARAPADGEYPLFLGEAPSGAYDLYLLVDFVNNGHLDITPELSLNGAFAYFRLLVP